MSLMILLQGYAAYLPLSLTVTILLINLTTDKSMIFCFKVCVDELMLHCDAF